MANTSILTAFERMWQHITAKLGDKASKTEAQNYALDAANTVKNDLLNGAGGAYDTLKELGDLIDNNVDAIDALEVVAAGKADKEHTHTVSDIADLTATATELNRLDGVTSNIQAQIDSKLSTSGGTISGVITTTDGDAFNRDVTTSGTYYYGGTNFDDGAFLGLYGKDQSSYAGQFRLKAEDGENFVYLEGRPDGVLKWGGENVVTVDRTGLIPINKGGTGASTATDALQNLGLTTTATELNYMDGVTSNVQAQLDNKAPSSHEHSASKITSGILAVEQGGTGNMWGYVRAGAQEGSTIGSLATAEGRETIASGYCSHAEGNYCEATGTGSHAEGQNTEASGTAAHSEGEGTEAGGNFSHAEGEKTVASGKWQHVQGKYNIEDTTDTYAHIVGNGESNSTRSNAHTLDWDGNAWFAGDIFVGGTSQDDTSASKVVTKADQRWNLLYDSGEISAIANSISNIDVSGYTNIQVLVRIYNDGDSINSRAGSAIFTCENGKTYQFPVWSNMFSKSINTVYVMATFNLVDGWLICPCASRLIGDATTFEDAEGGTAGSLSPTGSGMMKCTSPLSTLTVSSLDQNSNYYFGMGSRVMVWGWNA